MNCKAVLGTESCISFIDFDGTVMPKVDAYEQGRPDESAVDIQAKFLGKRDGEIVIRVISPRCFEAAALRTLMILYPGSYSEILEPWRHYVPLQRDHSNMDEVVAVLRDPARAKAIIDNAYKEIALNPTYSFRAMVEEFDQDLDKHARAKAHRSLCQSGNANPSECASARRATKNMAGYQRRSTLIFLKHNFLLIYALSGWLIRTFVSEKHQATAWVVVRSIAHPKLGLAIVTVLSIRKFVPEKHQPACRGAIQVCGTSTGFNEGI